MDLLLLLLFLFTSFFSFLFSLQYFLFLSRFLLTQKLLPLSLSSIETRVTQVSGKISGNLSITELGTGSQGCTICIGVVVGRQSRSSPFLLFKTVVSCFIFLSLLFAWLCLRHPSCHPTLAWTRTFETMTRGIPKSEKDYVMEESERERERLKGPHILYLHKNIQSLLYCYFI